MFLIFVFTVALWSLLDANQFRCDYTNFAKAKGYLKLHKIPGNWHDARLRCHLEGSILASPLNSEISSAMEILMDTNSKASGVFTGISAIFSRGDFHSVEGVPLSKIPNNWAKYEPNNYHDQEQYIMMLPSGELADVNETEPLPYFCYKKTKKNLFMNNCGTTDPGYELDPSTGSCYKFHKLIRTWSRAFMTCAAEGGYLAIINSEAESQVVKDLFAKHPADTLHNSNSDWKNLAFMGIHDWGEHDEFLTIKGQSLEEAGFASFAPGHPILNVAQYCGGADRSGRYYNLLCDVKLAFICEKDPESLLCDNI